MPAQQSWDRTEHALDGQPCSEDSWLAVPIDRKSPQELIYRSSSFVPLPLQYINRQPAALARQGRLTFRLSHFVMPCQNPERNGRTRTGVLDSRLL